jgi:chain length determinant protein EpsF
MTFSQFLTILRARWMSATIVLMTVIATTLLVSLLLPKQYTATASVLVDVKSPDPIIGMALAGIVEPGYMASQLDIIQSERVALLAIHALHLTESTELREKWQDAADGKGNFEAWLAELVQKKLDVKPSRESNAITVGYTSTDPRFSAAMANAFIQGYIDTTLDLRVEPAKQYNSFFDDRAKQLREAVEAAQAKLSTYQRSVGIVATDERLDVETAQLNELASQYVAMQTLAAESGSRQAQTGTNAERMPEVLNNPVVASLKGDLSRQEAHLKELNERLGDQHPEVKQAQANIAQLQSRINSESRRVSGSVGVNNNVNQSRLTQLRAAVQEQRAKVLQLKSQRDDAAVLQRDAENAQRAYDAVVARASQTNLESRTTQTNVSVLKRATEPALPSFPKILLNTAVAAFVGTLLAIGVALARELADRRLRTIEDITGDLHQPLLVELPKMPLGPQAAEAPRLRRLKARVLSGLPRPASR